LKTFLGEEQRVFTCQKEILKSVHLSNLLMLNFISKTFAYATARFNAALADIVLAAKLRVHSLKVLLPKTLIAQIENSKYLILLIYREQIRLFYSDPHKSLESNIPGYIYRPIAKGAENIISVKEQACGAVGSQYVAISKDLNSRIDYMKETVIPPIVKGTQNIMQVKEHAEKNIMQVKEQAKTAVVDKYTAVRDYVTPMVNVRITYVNDTIILPILKRFSWLILQGKFIHDVGMSTIAAWHKLAISYFDLIRVFALAKLNWALDFVGMKQKQE
jgi:hypothetical protein